MEEARIASAQIVLGSHYETASVMGSQAMLTSGVRMWAIQEIPKTIQA